MSWRYGLTVTRLPGGQDWYEVRELFSGKNGRWDSWTENPIAGAGKTRQEAIDNLKMMLDDCKKFKAKRIPPTPINHQENK